MLRIDFWNIAFIIINLLVLYFFMKHFLIGPVTKIVEERRLMVEKDLDDAARAKEEAGRIKAQYEAAAAGADHLPYRTEILHPGCLSSWRQRLIQ